VERSGDSRCVQKRFGAHRVDQILEIAVTATATSASAALPGNFRDAVGTRGNSCINSLIGDGLAVAYVHSVISNCPDGG
jgi:hypothetical protein